MAVAHEEPHPVHPALHEAREHPAPVHLVLAQVRVDREDRAVAVREDPGHYERRDRHDDAVDPRLVVGRVREDDLHLANRAVAPGLQLAVELAHGPRDLVGRDVHVAQLGEYRLHLARRHSLDVHLGDRHPERPVAPRPALEAAGVERTLGPTHLRNLEAEVAGGGPHGLGLVAVGVAGAARRALVPRGSQVKLALEAHGEVVEPRHHGGEALHALVHQHLHHFDDFGIICLCLSHSVLFLWLLKEYYEPARAATLGLQSFSLV